MSPKPRVSVVLPVHNGEEHLYEAVESILAQTLADFELLVIDDGSTDSTAGILAALGDERIRVLSQPNLGLIASLNRGLDQARGEYLARMDHDDISLPGRLELQVGWLDSNTDYAAVGCQFAQVDEAGRLLNRAVPLPLENQDIRRRLSGGKLGLLHSAILCRRRALIEIGGYDPGVLDSEDVDLIYRLASHYRLANLSQVAYLYRIRLKAVSTREFTRQRRNERILNRAWKRFLASGEYSIPEEERGLFLPEEQAMNRKQDDALIASHYHNRMGRALLRGRDWPAARKQYLSSARIRPVQLLAYLGVVRSILRMGGVHETIEWAGDWPADGRETG